ncbi:MAG: hypothetical protein IJO26_02255 [Clostridium sp.]|nr:hypothetical protein [Clostridium sp.]
MKNYTNFNNAKSRLEISKNLLYILYDETIAEKTGLNIEEIKVLRGKKL